MPKINIRGAEIDYEVRGEGPETIVFSHGLLWSARMFEKQVELLSGRYRCISYDHRGQGRSSVPSESTITIDSVSDDAVALIEALGLAPCHFVGLSMGGFVALRLAVKRPDLLRSIAILNSSAEPEPKENLPKYGVLKGIVQCGGLAMIAGRVMPIMFGQTFLNDPARADERRYWLNQLKANKRSIVKSVNGVLARDGMVDQLSAIKLPTLVCVGTEDAATVPAKGERVAAGIEGATLRRIENSGHSSSIEQPEAVNAALLEHFARVAEQAS